MSKITCQAEVQTAQFDPSTGRNVYIALCRQCFEELENSDKKTELNKFGTDFNKLA